MTMNESAPEPLLAVVSDHRQRGEKAILLNLSEQSFRSFFNQYTDTHRRLFVSLVLDQILLSCPNPFFLLYSLQANRSDDFTADEVFQSYAAIWLHEHGHRNFLTANSLIKPESQLSPLLDSLDLAISCDDALVRAVLNCKCSMLALMGSTKSYSRSDSLTYLLANAPHDYCRCVGEIHAISSEIRSALNSGQPEGLSNPSTQRELDKSPAHAVQTAHQVTAVSLGIDERQEFDINSAELERSLRLLTEAHFRNLAAQADRPGCGLASITFDGDPSFVPDMLERDSMHDADYVIFRVFQNPGSLILDIGANWGYSVSSIESSGAKSGIVSFEAIPMYRPCLAAIAELRPKKYHYFMTALSDSTSELIFTIPVINNQGLSALTTAAEKPNIESMVGNIVTHIRLWMPEVEGFQYRLVSFRVPVQRIDDVVIANPVVFDGRDIVAIKIDVEGMEFPVLRGAEDLLSSHRPLIMAEDAAQNVSLVHYLSGLGYLMAERDGSTLRLADRASVSGVNGFFIHRDKLEQYRDLGILD